jgi:diacylglycerol kinase family enzyme
VLGAGNANDHRRVMRDEPLITLIEQAEVKSFDLLKLTASTDTFELTRYAHSYIGFGITPEVGNELNKRTKSIWSEIAMILKTYHTYAPFEVTTDNETFVLDNLVFANINEMAKFIKLDEVNTARDGRFEVILLRHRSKLRMLGTLIRAAVVGFKDAPSVASYRLTIHQGLPIQLDGEIEKLPAECTVTVSSEHQAIDSLF